MIVVGVGCGPGMLTEEAIRAIEGAKHIYTSKRSLELVKEHVSPDAEVHILVDYSKLDDLPENAVLLSTGDPMLAGLGKHGGTIVPGISSFQLAFARLHRDLVTISVVDAHGQDAHGAIDEVVEELARGKTVFLLTEPRFPFLELMGRLRREGLDGTVAVCEDLGYPGERVDVGTTERPPEPRSQLYSVVLWTGR